MVGSGVEVAGGGIAVNVALTISARWVASVVGAGAGVGLVQAASTIAATTVIVSSPNFFISFSPCLIRHTERSEESRSFTWRSPVNALNV
jgi:hypothetical protein